MIRLPKYLDEEKLRDLADYAGLEFADAIDIRRTSTDQTGRRIGLNAAVNAEHRAGSSGEVSEAFTQRRGVVGLLNQIVNSLIGEGTLTVVGEDDKLPGLVQRSLLELSGEVQMHPASEIAQYFDLMLPVLAQHGDVDTIPVEKVIQSALSPTSRNAPVVFELIRGEADTRLLMVLHPSKLRNCDFEDLEGSHSTLALVDRVVGPDQQLSLRRYLVPQLTRSIRRALEGDALDETIKALAGLTGTDYDADTLIIGGPAALLTAAAIYA